MYASFIIISSILISCQAECWIQLGPNFPVTTEFLSGVCQITPTGGINIPLNLYHPPHFDLDPYFYQNFQTAWGYDCCGSCPFAYQHVQIVLTLDYSYVSNIIPVLYDVIQTMKNITIPSCNCSPEFYFVLNINNQEQFWSNITTENIFFLTTVLNILKPYYSVILQSDPASWQEITGGVTISGFEFGYCITEGNNASCNCDFMGQGISYQCGENDYEIMGIEFPTVIFFSDDS